MCAQFTNKLAVARTNAGMTQQDVAAALGCTVQAYQNYEYGKRDIKGTTLAELADIFGCTVNYLLGLDAAHTAPSLAPTKSPEDECRLLELYRSLTPTQQAAVLGVMEAMQR